MNTHNVGWDVGGAHVKAAVVNGNGDMLRVFLEPCPLWQGIDRLQQAVNRIKEQLPKNVHHHALTMTGELVDLFAGRDEGVTRIIEAMAQLLGRQDILVFAGRLGFLNAADVSDQHKEAIASANWLASATFAARRVGRGLFVDIGSTTTDILLLSEDRVITEGYTDYERLISKELVYTGIVRTAVMAVAQTALDAGREVGVMAEYFATMADVYRVTGELDELHDQCETADGAEKTVTASARRLSRMIGCDFKVDELPRWRQFAEHLRSRQLHLIQHGCELQLSRLNLNKSRPFVGAGVGRFLVRQLALSLGYPYLDFAEFFPDRLEGTELSAADCAPAVAVAILAFDDKQGDPGI